MAYPPPTPGQQAYPAAGAPVSPYAPGAPAAPPGYPPPPPGQASGLPGPAMAGALPPRPAAVGTAVVLFAVAAVCQLVQVAVRLLGTLAAPSDFDLGLDYHLQTVVRDGAVFVGLAVAALFVMLRSGGGRLAAFAMAGIACWEAFGWLLSFGFALFDGLEYWRWYSYVELLLAMIAAGFAAAGFVLLAGRATAAWFSRQGGAA